MRKTNAGRRAGNHLQSKDRYFSTAQQLIIYFVMASKCAWESLEIDTAIAVVDAACDYALTRSAAKGEALTGEAARQWPFFRLAVEQHLWRRIQL